MSDESSRRKLDQPIRGGYQPLQEGYSPVTKRGYVPVNGTSLPKAPIGGTGQSQQIIHRDATPSSK
jgi:hypothetical protein